MKRLAYILVLVMTLVAPVMASAFTVVIDPGHGGKDYGCTGSKAKEKTIVLNVAQKLGALIAEEHPEVNIIYTRNDDRFIPLNDRANIANRAHADLFISIHVNSVDRRNRNRASIHGASVYTLGLHRTDDNLAVAMRENRVIELENDFSETYQGFDPNSSESYIIFELTQNRHQRNSIELAEEMRNELVHTAGRADKGVLQSGFLVLRATSMPSVLVELDFICNAEAEKFLNSDAGQDKCARSLANAFGTYYERHKDSPTPGTPAQVATEASVPAQGITYLVQFLTSDTPLPEDDSRLRGIDNVSYYYDNKLYKYTSGCFTTLNEAKRHLRTIKKKYSEAFIIKMKDGKRVN